MKKTIAAILFVLSCATASANQFTDFPDTILPELGDGCLPEDGCIFANRVVSMYGFQNSVGAGNHFNADDTGAVNLDILGVASRIDLKGTTLFQKAQFDTDCGPSGLVDLNFGGDYYVLNVTKNCLINGISSEHGGTIPNGHEIKLRIVGGVSSLMNMVTVPAGYAPLKMPGSQGMNYNAELLVRLLKDDGVWLVEQITMY